MADPNERDRIDCNDKGDLDDIVINNVEMLHMEWMDDNTVWLRCYRKEKQDVIFWLTYKKKITGCHEIEEAPL